MSKTKTTKKQLARKIVGDITSLIVDSHLAVHAPNDEKKEELKNIMAQRGLELTHTIFEAIK